MPMIPDDDENRDDFLDRCISEMSDANPDWDDDRLFAACSNIWEERRGGKHVVRKTKAAAAGAAGADGVEFILSDETVDRMNDIIIADGWQLDNFNKNPVALFNHKSDFPIGTWEGLRVEGKALRGYLKLAKKGTSARIDEIVSLVEQGVLRAVSVGFAPIEAPQPRDKAKNFGGSIFPKNELVETSVVSVPANPNALAVAKSLGISRGTLDLVFAGHGNKKNGTARSNGHTGGQAETPPAHRGRIMTPLSKRIEDGQKALVEMRDQLTAHLEKVDDDNVSDTDLATTQEFNRKIEQRELSLAALIESEKRTAATSKGNGSEHSNGNGNGNLPDMRPFSFTPKKLSPVELLVRSGVVAYFAHTQRMPIDVVRERIYPGNEAIRVMTELAVKAATVPATTTLAGWAAELAQTVNAGIMETLTPSAVYPRLSARGVSLTFGRNGKINVPTRANTPTIAGSFVGEGAAIPVRQGAFTTISLTPKKMAVITTWTREIDEHSVPAIEGLLRNAVQEDTAVSLDAVLLDANPATLVRPAGILNGVAALTATAGGGFTALVGDIKALTGALLTGTNGNIRALTWLMNPIQANAIALTQAPNVNGMFPFQDQINNGNLMGSPVIVSGTVPVGVVIAIDAADFVSVSGDTPRFEISDQATLHMEDTTPLPIVTGAQGSGVVASPTRSLWQTDSLALRLILPVNWALRRTGVVAWTQAVTW